MKQNWKQNCSTAERENHARVKDEKMYHGWCGLQKTNSKQTWVLRVVESFVVYRLTDWLMTMMVHNTPRVNTERKKSFLFLTCIDVGTVHATLNLHCLDRSSAVVITAHYITSCIHRFMGDEWKYRELATINQPKNCNLYSEILGWLLYFKVC